MIVYNKLIRDKIPQIIAATGKKSEIRVLAEDEYTEMLNVKLQEELDEYKIADGSDQISELADLVEVVYAILDQKSISIEEFEKVRLDKRAERGAFKDKLLLLKVE
jgi:predicted house-cleaning noncanonical NTP pyrophosphatase (MazG superfamily)